MRSRIVKGAANRHPAAATGRAAARPSSRRYHDFGEEHRELAAGTIQAATNRAAQQQIRLHDRGGRRGKRHADMPHHAKQRKAEHDVQRNRHDGDAKRRARVFAREIRRRRDLDERKPEQTRPQTPAATTTPSRRRTRSSRRERTPSPSAATTARTAPRPPARRTADTCARPNRRSDRTRPVSPRELRRDRFGSNTVAIVTATMPIGSSINRSE